MPTHQTQTQIQGEPQTGLGVKNGLLGFRFNIQIQRLLSLTKSTTAIEQHFRMPRSRDIVLMGPTSGSHWDWPENPAGPGSCPTPLSDPFFIFGLKFGFYLPTGIIQNNPPSSNIIIHLPHRAFSSIYRLIPPFPFVPCILFTSFHLSIHFLFPSNLHAIHQQQSSRFCLPGFAKSAHRPFPSFPLPPPTPY